MTEEPSLGLARNSASGRKSYRDVKDYRWRKRWLG
jgi:hypothetical protein